jgi:hypothetical protein
MVQGSLSMRITEDFLRRITFSYIGIYTESSLYLHVHICVFNATKEYVETK